jgi:dTDP-4-amino-4,6-dideoxy-D-galactose acyltransferase
VSATTMSTGQPALVRLDWECDHFALRVAKLANPDLTNIGLAAALRKARSEGVQLVVWPAESGRQVGDELLAEFAGALVDRKATFTRSLPAGPAGYERSSPVDVSVVPYTAPGPSAALYDLAISAGAYSRFRVDARLSGERFEAMYRRWIEGSVTGELADAVLVALAADVYDGADVHPSGMITLSESAGVASIGLIAVSPAARGKGMGSALVQAAHRWMQDRGACASRVVTQLANAPACRLYERSGYRLSAIEHFYHFWP